MPPPPDQRVALVTGLPRAGTTLTCHLLGSLPDTVALPEPMDLATLENKSPQEILGRVDHFIDETRASLLDDRTAHSMHIAGEVPEDPVSGEQLQHGLRKSIASSGRIRFDKTLSTDFLLVIKHNAGFAAILEHLARRYLCYAVVRNPLALLASWQSVDLPINSGHVPVGERLDGELRLALARIEDSLDRQLHILDWFCDRFVRFIAPERVIRYEDVVATRGRALSIVTPRALDLDRTLQSRNTGGERHRRECYDMLASRLMSSRGTWQHFYAKEGVESLRDSV